MMTSNALRGHIDSLSSRYRWIRARETFLDAAFTLTMAGTIILLALKIGQNFFAMPAEWTSPSTVIRVLALTLTFSLVLGAVAWKTTSIPIDRLAFEVDQAMHLDERFLTACDAALHERSTSFTEAQIQDTLERLGSTDVRRHVRAPRIGYRWGVLVGLIAAVAISLFPHGTVRASAGRHNGYPVVTTTSNAQNAEGVTRSDSPAEENSSQPAVTPQTEGGITLKKDPPSMEPKEKSRPGTEEGRLYGNKTDRPKVDPIPEGVRPIESNGPWVEKNRPVYTPDPTKQGTTQTIPYEQVFPQYKKMAEDAIHRETIPPEAREFIKKYFESIQPK